MYRKNTAGQFIHIQGVDSATGGIKSGVTWTVRRCLDGTFAAATGTATEDGTTGWYKFALSQADTNGNNCAFNFTGTGAVPQTVNFVTTACDPTSTAFGLSLAKTTNITGFNDIAATAVVSGGAITTSGGAVSTVTSVANNVNAVLANTAHGGAAASMNLAIGLTSNITGNLSGSVGSVTGAVGSVTGAVGSVTGNVGGNVVGSVGSVTSGVTVSTNSDKTGYSISGTKTTLDALNDPSVADIADGVWDEVLSGHLTAGTTGNALNAAGAAGDPWSTSLPGAYGAGTAGKIIGDNLNATVSSRATQASVDTVDTVVDAILADTGTDGVVVAAGSKTGYSLTATTGLGNQTADITGNLSGSVGSVTGAVGSVTGLTASDVAAIKAKTDSLAFTVAGQVDANIQYVNDVLVTGTGAPGNEWGP